MNFCLKSCVVDDVSVKFVIDVYKFLQNKWTWFFGGIGLLIIAFLVSQAESSELELLANTAELINLICTTIGILVLIFWFIWWLYENWDKIRSYFD